MNFYVCFLFSILQLIWSNDGSTSSPPPSCGEVTKMTVETVKTYDLWDPIGNTQLLDALNAALYEILPSTAWKNIEAGLGVSTPVPPKEAPWPSTVPKGTFKMIMEEGEIRFGSTLNTPPFGYNNSGCLEGAEIKLGNLIAQKFSDKYAKEIKATWVEIVKTGDFWTDVSFGLSGDFLEKSDTLAYDVILSTVTATSSRASEGKGRFTHEYVRQPYGIGLGPTGVQKNLTVEDLNLESTKIAVGKGTTNEEYVKKTWPLATVIETGTFTERKAKAKNGDADAAVGDELLIVYFFQNTGENGCGPNCKFLTAHGDPTKLAMAVRPEKQPSAETSSSECTILDIKKTEDAKSCTADAASRRCIPCSGASSCNLLLAQKKEGTCCSSKFCCQRQKCDKYSCKCQTSVKRQWQVKCKTGYKVEFDVQGTHPLTGKPITGKYFESCGHDGTCQKRVMDAHPKNSKTSCTIDPSTGMVKLTNITGVSGGSSSFVGSVPKLVISCLLVFFFTGISFN